MTQARRVTEALPGTAPHSTKLIYLQQDLNSKDCRESIVKITKYLQEGGHKFKSSNCSRVRAQSDKVNTDGLFVFNIYIYIYIKSALGGFS